MCLVRKRNIRYLMFLIFHITFLIFRIIFSISYYILNSSYYVLTTYTLVLIFNRMSKKLKVVSKKLFRRKSKTGPEDTLFRGSTSGSSRPDEIMKHIDPTLVGRTTSSQRSEVTLIFSYHFAILIY
jgi:hypothetical protein